MLSIIGGLVLIAAGNIGYSLYWAGKMEMQVNALIESNKDLRGEVDKLRGRLDWEARRQQANSRRGTAK